MSCTEQKKVKQINLRLALIYDSPSEGRKKWIPFRCPRGGETGCAGRPEQTSGCRV